MPAPVFIPLTMGNKTTYQNVRTVDRVEAFGDDENKCRVFTPSGDYIVNLPATTVVQSLSQAVQWNSDED